MNKLLRKCVSCSSYTLQLKCPKCGSDTKSPHPPKFSPDDKYIRYRVRERYALPEQRQESASLAEPKQEEGKKELG